MIANNVAKAIESTDTAIVMGMPDRMSGAQIARNAGSTRPVEAIATTRPPTRISQVRTKIRRKLSRARAREAATARTMASGPPATTSS